MDQAELRHRLPRVWACATRGCYARRWRRLAICYRCRTAIWRELYR